MGQLLSEPISEKHSSFGKDDRLIYGASGMQGWRITMEDAHITDLNVKKDGDTSPGHSSVFAVFDGHAGDSVAKYCRSNLVRILFKKMASLDDSGGGGGGANDSDPCMMKKVLCDTFLGLDEEILKDEELGAMSFLPGCTANVALIDNRNTLYLANAGDSRAIMSENGVAIELSEDHKPNAPVELERITKAGGFVEFGRVNGNLALSRAIGDFDYKKRTDISPENQIVTAYPDVSMRNLSKESDEFMVLACDGIWDVLTNQQVINFVRAGIVAGKEMDKICEELMDTCISSVGDPMSVGCDNMTVIIVGFLMGDSIEAWRKRCSQKCDLADMEEHQIPTKAEGGPAAFGGTKKQQRNAAGGGVLGRILGNKANGEENNDIKTSQTTAEALLNAILKDQFKQKS